MEQLPRIEGSHRELYHPGGAVRVGAFADGDAAEASHVGAGRAVAVGRTTEGMAAD